MIIENHPYAHVQSTQWDLRTKNRVTAKRLFSYGIGAVIPMFPATSGLARLPLSGQIMRLAERNHRHQGARSSSPHWARSPTCLRERDQEGRSPCHCLRFQQFLWICIPLGHQTKKTPLRRAVGNPANDLLAVVSIAAPR